jgi:hypothetical protein
MQEINVRQWQENFRKGKYALPNFETQCEAGWYDWFCNDGSLAKKTQRMGKIIEKITNPYILENYYVWFKNCCPVFHPLYDTFRFSDLEGQDVQFTISIDDEREEYNYVVYGRLNDFQDPLFQCNDLRQLVKYFNELVLN